MEPVMKPKHFKRSMFFALTVCAFNGMALAQEDATEPAGTAPSVVTESASQPVETQPVPAEAVADEADAEQAMNDLLGSREAAPVIEPTTDSDIEYPGLSVDALGASIDIDPAVLGIAPGEDPPPLRREGEFIVNRRGRLIQSAKGGHLLFVFESDTQDNPELPMVFQACRILEAMEDTVQRRGNTTVFIISGQVHTYRGANYLLPTMMKIAVDKGNLTN
jgi:hypothetical protein